MTFDTVLFFRDKSPHGGDTYSPRTKKTSLEYTNANLYAVVIVWFLGQKVFSLTSVIDQLHRSSHPICVEELLFLVVFHILFSLEYV